MMNHRIAGALRWTARRLDPVGEIEQFNRCIDAFVNAGGHVSGHGAAQLLAVRDAMGLPRRTCPTDLLMGNQP